MSISIRKSEIVAALRQVRDTLQGLAEGEADARLHVWQAEDSFGVATYWKVDWGCPDYDLAHGQYIGAVSVSATDRVKDLPGLAEDLIGQVMDQVAE